MELTLRECEWADVSDGSVVCVRCHKTLPRKMRQRCRLPGETEAPRGDGLGDLVEGALTKIGVTPERYNEVRALFGLPPCDGCAKRKAWLNKVSAWWRGESTTPQPAE